MHDLNIASFVRFSLAAVSFLAGVGCEACWLKMSAPVPPPKSLLGVTVDHRSSPPPAEKPPAADTLAPVASVADASTDSWTRAAAEGDHLHRAHRFENLGASLTRMDPHEALLVIAETPVGVDRTSLLRGFFGQLAQGSDAATAISLAMQLAARDERETALAALVDQWTTDAPNSLSHRAFYISRNNLETGLGMELLAAGPANLDRALSWAAQVKSADGQATLLSAIAKQMVPTDPAAAIAVGSALTGNRYVSFLRGTLESWAQSDPQAALAWAAQITDPAIRRAAQEGIGSGWAAMDDEQISLGYLSTISPGTARTEFIRSMMQTQQIMHSPNEVNAWIARLNDPADRATAQALVEDAPTPVTGIGARLDLNNGLVIVDSLMSDSPAARGAELKVGDRILAVAQPGEEFAPASSVDLDSVVDMIRGAVGSDVRLKIASPQPGGYGPPHVIQITRSPLDPGH